MKLIFPLSELKFTFINYNQNNFYTLKETGHLNKKFSTSKIHNLKRISEMHKDIS